MPQNHNQKLSVNILDKDRRMSLWTDENESLEELQERDDLLGRSQIELDLSKADGKVKDHEVKFGVIREATGKEMTLSFSTKVLTVDGNHSLLLEIFLLANHLSLFVLGRILR